MGLDMLLYHPAFDINHCIFRILRLLTKLPTDDHEIERIKILDFYLLFPQEINRMKFPRALLSFKRQIRKHEQRYEEFNDPHRIFHQLEPLQIIALKCLAAYNLIDAESLSQGKVRRTVTPIPKDLQETIEKANSVDSNIIDLLTRSFNSISLYGDKGLKARTELLEYQYDPS